MWTSNNNPLPSLSDNDLISKLPDELKLRIIKNLDIPGVAATRLTSQKWAEIGAEQLLSAGLIIPHLLAMPRLLKASSRPLFANNIRSLILFVPEPIHKEIRKELKTMGGCKYLRDVRWNELEERMPKVGYVDYLNVWTLKQVFSKMPKLDSIVLKGTSFAFWHCKNCSIPSFIADIITISPACFNLLATRQRCTNVLMSLQCLPTPLRKLVLDPLPLSNFFAWSSETPKQQQAIKDAITQSLGSVEDLIIYFENTGMVLPDDEDAREAPTAPFQHFFQAMPCLQSLTIRFAETDHEVENETSGWFTRAILWIKWSRLENVIFENALCSWENLWAFLLQHSKTLRRLKLSGDMVVDLSPVLESATPLDWEECLKDVQAHLNLECFELLVLPTDGQIYGRGTCYSGTENPDGGWVKLPCATDSLGSFPAFLLEKFVRGEYPWPMEDQAIGWNENDEPEWDIAWERLLLAAGHLPWAHQTREERMKMLKEGSMLPAGYSLLQDGKTMTEIWGKLSSIKPIFVDNGDGTGPHLASVMNNAEDDGTTALEGADRGQAGVTEAAVNLGGVDTLDVGGSSDAFGDDDHAFFMENEESGNEADCGN